MRRENHGARLLSCAFLTGGVIILKEILDSAAFTDMLLCAAAALEQNKQHINELNVFPVPDGDTGTNMSMTLSAGAAELRAPTMSAMSQNALPPPCSAGRAAIQALSFLCFSAGFPRD